MKAKWFSAMLLSAACVAAARADSGGEILQSTGVQGGVVVHVGCGDGRLTAAFRASESYLVHGLDNEAEDVRRAREHIQALGLYGNTSADWFDGKRLPYVDNLVNLVVAEDLGGVAMEEVTRVLAPGGVAYVKQDGAWSRKVKPRPKDIDAWTHYLHDSTGNAVARDAVVGPPRRTQWVGSPRWARSHEHTASLNALILPPTGPPGATTISAADIPRRRCRPS